MFQLPTAATRSLVAATALGLLSSIAAGPAEAAVIGPRFAAPALRAAPARTPSQAITFTYKTLDDAADPTFNQLLGINNARTISGYFGSGAPGHPNKGYTIAPPYGQSNYTNENFPGSVQTQVTGLNDKKDTVGFWVDGSGNNFGFVQWNGVFTSYKNPHTGKGTVNQLLGINNAGIAVGFYTDVNGVNHAYSVNQATSKYTAITPPGLSSPTATGINNSGDICGFGTAANGAVVSFLLKAGKYSEALAPGSTNTQAFGINSKDAIVGSFVDGAGATHGFLLTNPLTHAAFQQLDDPNGVGNTLANGINDFNDVVGFYVDAAGNTDGFLAVP
jgi:hypothetical protein